MAAGGGGAGERAGDSSHCGLEASRNGGSQGAADGRARGALLPAGGLGADEEGRSPWSRPEEVCPPR